MQDITGTPDDPTITFTPLDLRGKKYLLLFNLTALAKAQKATGFNFLRDSINLNEFDANQYAALVHAGLGRMHPEITLEQVADMIDVRNFAQVVASVASAFSMTGMEPDANPPIPAPAD